MNKITLFIEKWLCKMNFHRLTWKNGDTGEVHCYCYKVTSKDIERDKMKLWCSLHRWADMIWERGDIKKFNSKKFEKTGIADWIEADEIAASIMSYIRDDDKITFKR